MKLYFACVSLMFMSPSDKGPCTPISRPQREDQCIAVLLDWLARAEAWRIRSGIQRYRPFGMCMPAEWDEA